MSDKTTQCPSGDTCKLLDEIVELRERVDHLSELVSTDPLTGLYNYRHFSRCLTQELERSLRTSQPTSLIMIDIDHFKKVNDVWGHETGNLALNFIANCIINNIRKLDIACRYGGEEFAVILPSSDIVTSAKVAERIRLSIEETPLLFQDNKKHEQELFLTASAGLSTLSGKNTVNDLTSAKALVSAADEQLYRAKKQGRNQVCFIEPAPKEQQVSGDEKSALFGMFKDTD